MTPLTLNIRLFTASRRYRLTLPWPPHEVELATAQSLGAVPEHIRCLTLDTGCPGTAPKTVMADNECGPIFATSGN